MASKFPSIPPHSDVLFGLESLAKSAFPRKCHNCSKIFKSFDELLEATRSLNRSNGIMESIDDNDKPILELYRNCTCGSTLVEFCRDRRDMSPEGIARRKRFGALLESLEEQGLSRNVARRELLKIVRGESSTVLSEFLGFSQSQKSNS